jgi:hypothetical protein
VVAGLLAAVFLIAGTNKLLIPQEKVAKAPGGGWALDFSAGFVKALGAVEILGAVGMILPALLDTTALEGGIPLNRLISRFLAERGIGKSAAVMRELGTILGAGQAMLESAAGTSW